MDCPNRNLAFTINMVYNEIEMAIFPEIDLLKCNGCGLCVNVCQRGGLILVEDPVVAAVETADCDYCGYCEAVCLPGAIRCAYEIVFEGN